MIFSLLVAFIVTPWASAPVESQINLIGAGDHEQED